MQESVNQQSRGLKNSKNSLKNQEQKTLLIQPDSLDISQLENINRRLNIQEKVDLRVEKIRQSHPGFKIQQVSVKSSSNSNSLTEKNQLRSQISKTYRKLKQGQRIPNTNVAKQNQSHRFHEEDRVVDINCTSKEKEIWEIQVMATEKFKKQHPHFCRGHFILFPVEDKLFDDYHDLLEPFYIKRHQIKATPLPDFFEPLLEVWNTLKTFAEYFLAGKTDLSLPQVQRMMLDDDQFTSIISRILDVFLRDFTNEKNEVIKKSNYGDFFCLLRFCIENGLMDKIYKRCWPILLHTLLQLLCGEEKNSKSGWIFKQLKQLTFKCAKNCTSDVLVRCKIVALFCELMTQTSQFRRMISQKGQKQKKEHKKFLELEQKKKKLIKQISKINQQERQSQKQERINNIMKMSDELGDLKSNLNHNNSTSKLETVRTRKADLLAKLSRIEDQMRQIEEIKTVLTSVQCLGQDKIHNNYWIILSYQDKIFMSSDGQWSYYSAEQIENLIGNLNLRGYRQSSLYKSIVSHYSPHNFRRRSKKQEFQFKQVAVYKQKMIVEGSINQYEDIFQEIVFLLTDSQKRLTQYLQQRNSRWGNQSQRKKFYAALSRMHQDTIPNILETLRQFNQKVCVVQTEYKRINQQSAEQIDTKVRKVQTKIWGISQKYKTHWTQFSQSIKVFPELFFLIYILCLNIEKYTSKNRKKRKEFELVKEYNRFFKTANCRKDDLAWEQICQQCKDGGQLLCCDMCPKVFHLACLDVAEPPEDRFICQECNNTRNIRKLLRKSKE